ncbi:hypothetical protein F52700_7201 [Fusarium sp. NRRL 52700]|nr:hypothetical protein F52700_7201 [Fusarium sp. NRRL 52700]
MANKNFGTWPLPVTGQLDYENRRQAFYQYTIYHDPVHPDARSHRDYDEYSDICNKFRTLQRVTKRFMWSNAKPDDTTEIRDFRGLSLPALNALCRHIPTVIRFATEYYSNNIMFNRTQKRDLVSDNPYVQQQLDNLEPSGFTVRFWYSTVNNAIADTCRVEGLYDNVQFGATPYSPIVTEGNNCLEFIDSMPVTPTSGMIRFELNCSDEGTVEVYFDQHAASTALAQTSTAPAVDTATTNSDNTKSSGLPTTQSSQSQLLRLLILPTLALSSVPNLEPVQVFEAATRDPHSSTKGYKGCDGSKITKEQCAALCLADTNCQSFEWRYFGSGCANTCNLLTTNGTDIPTNGGSHSACAYYRSCIQKDECAERPLVLSSEVAEARKMPTSTIILVVQDPENTPQWICAAEDKTTSTLAAPTTTNPAIATTSDVELTTSASQTSDKTDSSTAIPTTTSISPSATASLCANGIPSPGICSTANVVPSTTICGKRDRALICKLERSRKAFAIGPAISGMRCMFSLDLTIDRVSNTPDVWNNSEFMSITLCCDAVTSSQPVSGTLTTMITSTRPAGEDSSTQAVTSASGEPATTQTTPEPTDCAVPSASLSDDVTCGIPGQSGQQAQSARLLNYIIKPVGSLANCAAVYLQRADSQGFAYIKSNNECYPFRVGPAGLGITYNPQGTEKYYDRGCFSCA